MTDSDKATSQNEVVCNIVKSSIAQAQKSHNTYIEMCEKMLVQSGAQDTAEFSQKALDLAKHDAAENLKFALKIADITDEAEAVRLHDEHANRQGQEMARRVEELQMLARGEEAAAMVPEAPVAEQTASTVEVSDDISMATTASAAATAAVLSAGAVTAVVGSSAEQAGASEVQPSIEDEIEALSAKVEAEHSIEAEIEALSAKIHEAKNSEIQSEAETASVAVETPVVEEAIAELEAAVVEEVVTDVEAPVVEEVTVAVVETPEAPEIPEISIEIPSVSEIPEISIEAPVAAEMTAAASESAASVVTTDTPAGTEAEAVVENTEPAPAEDVSFDTDLSARLDAVRAMLQGSDQ